MPDLSRRSLFRGVAAVTGAAVVGSAAPATGALAGTDAKRRQHGDIRDIKHVMILMQENRSFDHYFGSLQGVRGFGDRSIITLLGGYSVWQQPTTPPGQPVTGTQYPWRLASGTFTGTQQVTASYYQGGFDREPVLTLTLTNAGQQAVTFTVTPNHYSREPARTYHVPAHGSTTFVADPLATDNGWYDLSVTISGDASWSRRYIGHLEDGEACITG